MQRIASWVFFVTILSVLPAPRVLAHGPNDPPHQVFAMGDLKLESGETIKDFRISYITHGTLNAKKSNAILMTASIAGNHHRIDFLIGPGPRPHEVLHRGDRRHRQRAHHVTKQQPDPARDELSALRRPRPAERHSRVPPPTRPPLR